MDAPCTGEPACGVILAGGRSRRMGGRDKALLRLDGKPLLQHVIEAAAPQVGRLVLNVNADRGGYAGFGLPMAGDSLPGFAGPLAGVLTGMEWVRAHAPECGWVASFACDAPFIPGDLVARLRAAAGREGADMACARSAGRAHPVFGLWPVGLADDLRRAIADDGVRKVDAWTSRFRLAEVEFETRPLDPFFNVNGPDDLAAAHDAVKRP